MKTLSPAQQDKILQALELKNKAVSMPNMAKEGEAYPLSKAQQRLWFIDKMDGASSAYNIPCAIRIRGYLNIDSLEKSLQFLFIRHSMLRTDFIEKEGSLFQIIRANIQINFTRTSANEADIHQLVLEEASQPFDLKKAPLMRSKIISIGSNDYVFLLTLHHIIADGWSLNILIDELLTCYHAFSQYQQPNLPNLSFDYVDYCLWQQQYLTSPALQKDTFFWLEQLQDYPAISTFPLDKPRPTRQSFVGKNFRFLLDRDLTKKLDDLCKDSKVTLYMALLAIYNILLYRYSNQNDIMIGSPIGNRMHQGANKLIGFFANTIILRSKINGNDSFSEYVKSVRDAVLAVFDHQNMPFDHLVEKLRPERSPSYHPLFQVEFAFHNTPQSSLQLNGIKIDKIEIEETVSKFDISLSFEKVAAQLEGLFEFNTDIFSMLTIQRLAKHYVQLIENILANPQTKLNALTLITDEENELLLKHWAVSRRVVKLDKIAPVIFSEIANQFPERIVAKHRDKSLTYRDLEEKTNQLAHALLSQGMHKGDKIAFYLHRNLNYLIAILGVLKAGGTFIPMDPTMPSERNRKILHHLEADYILTCQKEEGDLLKIVSSHNIINMDNICFVTFPKEPPKMEIGLTDLAYIIYTSGSTGDPKGVMIEHKGMVNHLLAKIIDLEMRETDVVAQTAVQTFDVCVWQLLAPLLVGARAIILTEQEAWEPEALLTQLKNEKVTIFESIPSHNHLLLTEIETFPKKYDLSNLRLYITNGELMPTTQCERWFKLFPTIPIINAYGPTECSDDVSHLHMEAGTPVHMSYLPIKGALPNTKIYILDTLLNLVPIGVTGEIHIGGDCVGRGYLEDVEKTASVFIEDVFTQDKTARLYKTGDLARYHADGSIELLGRKDFQVKIRGMRIEIGEIEAVLQKHSTVSHCLVSAVKDKQEIYHLIAYVVIPARPAPNEQTLKRFCQQYIPDYMIPRHIMIIDEFPLLSNGKIDRKQLPLPGENIFLSENAILAKTALEKKLSLLWGEMLGVENVSINANFFQIGGHSLAMIALVGRMKLELQRDIALAKFFDAPTITDVIKNFNLENIENV